MSYNEFGNYIRDKRIENKISVRKMAELLDCSPAFVSSVEQGKRNPYDKDRLNRLSEIFRLSYEENNMMLTLAGKSKNTKSGDTIAMDLSEYINNNEHVSIALRTARDLNAGEEEWRRFVEDLKKRETGN